MPTGHRKLEKLLELLGKLRKSYRKAIGRSITGLQSRQILMVTRTIRRDATHGLRDFYADFYRDFTVFIQHVYGSLWRWKHWSAGFWAHFNYLLTYPALRTTKEDDNVDFSFLRWQLFTSDQACRSTRARILPIALGAECLSTPRIAFSNKTQEGNVKCPSSTREDSNSQRPTHVQAVSDD